MFTITLNGHNKSFSSSLSLSELIQKNCRPQQRVIAELNGQIIKSPDWPSTALQNGDQLELVTIVGGG
jgi:sulfur carrier protein